MTKETCKIKSNIIIKRFMTQERPKPSPTVPLPIKSLSNNSTSTIMKILNNIYYKTNTLLVIKYQKYVIIAITIIMGELFAYNSVTCGAVEEYDQPSIQLAETINTMNDQELMLLGEHLQPNRERFNIIQAQPNEIRINENNNGGRWEAVAFFIVGSIVLYMISRHGQTILDAVFNLRQIPEIIHETMGNIVQAAIQQGGIQHVRDIMIDRGNELLMNPHTANQVLAGLEAIHQLRVAQLD